MLTRVIGRDAKRARASLPERYCVLDRAAAAKGYTPENTRLICQACDVKSQASRGYT
jgi:hypothetical protein